MLRIPLSSPPQSDLPAVDLKASPKLIPEIQIAIGPKRNRCGGIIGTIADQEPP